jgi:hypothetical protein
MELQTEEITQIIKVGTSLMLIGAAVIIGLVVYFHNRLVKITNK